MYKYASIVAVLGCLAITPALADSSINWKDVSADWKDLQKDWKDLAHDRWLLKEAIQEGAKPSVIDAIKDDIRADKRDIHSDIKDLRSDFHKPKH
jgi:hypothetical protein